MDHQGNGRSFGSVHRVRRIRQVRASAGPLTRPPRRRPAGESGDPAVLAFLSEILIGDGAWTVGEVKRLVSMREHAERGRWGGAGRDDDGASIE